MNPLLYYFSVAIVEGIPEMSLYSEIYIYIYVHIYAYTHLPMYMCVSALRTRK